MPFLNPDAALFRIPYLRVHFETRLEQAIKTAKANELYVHEPWPNARLPRLHTRVDDRLPPCNIT
jgi:hypothetical protein